MIKNSRAQVWIETVIYTLIAFVMIAAVLAYAKPKIEEFQDKAVIDQSLQMVKEIDNIVLSVIRGGAGNKRIIEIGITKGELTIDSENDKIFFEVLGKNTYSEPGVEISDGNVNILTLEKGEDRVVRITRDYSESYNITYLSEENSKILTESPTSYKLSVSNLGKVNDTIQIDFEVI
jgi:archaellin